MGPRTRVLEIAAEGAGFELEAELDASGQPLAFFTTSGGPHDYEAVFGEPPEPRLEHGPMAWSRVLEEYLQPNAWLTNHPQFIHSAIADRVRKELVHASGDTATRWRAALGAAFRRTVTALYETKPNCIHPFIGETFASGEPSTLRVMTIGINAYLSADDWLRQDPEWIAGWFREGRHQFDRRVAEAAATIGRALETSECFAGLRYEGKANIFHTNAVKAFLPESEGKRSDQVAPQQFEAFASTWHAELDLMARHGVLPHVVIVFGRPFWEWAWKAFHPKTKPSFSHLEVSSFANAENEGHHFANRIEVEGAAGKQTLLLVALRHPAARAVSRATPEWLLAQDDVRRLFGLPAQ
jgi:hypothetical protein